MPEKAIADMSWVLVRKLVFQASSQQYDTRINAEQNMTIKNRGVNCGISPKCPDTERSFQNLLT